MIELNKVILNYDRQKVNLMFVFENSEIVNTLIEPVYHILNDLLDLKKLYVQQVPQFLNCH